MSRLRVETHEISGGLEEPRKIAVKISNGRHGTFDYPEYLSGIGAHEHCIAKLIDRETFDRIESFYKVGETTSGYRFTIFLKNEED